MLWMVPNLLLRFLSTLSLRRATEYWVGGYGTANNFYPRSPCGERLLGNVVAGLHMSNFYPRSPCGERLSCAWSASKLGDFYPRSPCGERRLVGMGRMNNHIISIHALLAESDWGPQWTKCRHSRFLSTLSLRRATVCFAGAAPAPNISIHALLAESDHNVYRDFGASRPFLSTLSLRRATSLLCYMIHLL